MNNTPRLKRELNPQTSNDCDNYLRWLKFMKVVVDKRT